jgi:general stress protein 26
MMNEAVIEGVPLAESDERTEQQQRKELYARIKKTKTCLLMTHDAVGGMHVRPMHTQQVEAAGIVWMFMSARGRLAEQIAANPDVLLTYGHPSDGAYAAVRGQAIAVHDIEKAKELWTAVAGAWFPGGPEDPTLALLRVTMSWAEAWEPTHGKVLQFLEIAAAALTKSVPQDDGTYRRIDF